MCNLSRSNAQEANCCITAFNLDRKFKLDAIWNYLHYSFLIYKLLLLLCRVGAVECVCLKGFFV